MKINRSHIALSLRVAVSAALLLYLVVALHAANSPAMAETCTGMTIAVAPGADTAERFVNAADIANELDGLPSRLWGRPLKSVNTESLRRRLSAIDKIESVDVFTSTNGRVNIRVTPLQPAARVFDRAGRSYYVNKDGKRMATNARYSMDVPVIVADFDSVNPAIPPEARVTLPAMLDLLDRLASNEAWGRIITMAELTPAGDIILVPAIDGHVINIGSPDALDSKLARVERMYRHVLPVVGWDYYDTISVKWAAQVVATRARKQADSSLDIVDDDADDADVTSMLTAEGVAPGQTRVGVPAHNEKRIPAARKAPVKPSENP